MLTVEDVRIYAKDIDILNKLLDGNLQSSDELISLAMKVTIGLVNMAPPVTEYTVENCPNDALMLYGVLHHLANSEAERQLRNQVTYNAQGLNVGIDDKYQYYSQLSQYYKGLFDQQLQSYKQYLNQQEAWGGNYSPYSYLPEWEFRS